VTKYQGQQLKREDLFWLMISEGMVSGYLVTCTWAKKMMVAEAFGWKSGSLHGR
jgi:hypothetical protein